MTKHPRVVCECIRVTGSLRTFRVTELAKWMAWKAVMGGRELEEAGVIEVQVRMYRLYQGRGQE